MKPIRKFLPLCALFACSVAFALNRVDTAERPQRIVSLSLCTDQLVLLLADRTQVASLSYLAGDEDLSYLSAAAAGIPTNQGTAEEALVLNPDLILAGPWGSHQAGKLLERLGYRVLFLPPANDIGTIRAQVLQVAEAVGQSDRGDAILGALERDLVVNRALRPASIQRTVLPYLGGGYTQGSGTLLDAVLRESGFINNASELGITGFASLALERVLLSNPDYLVVQPYRKNAPTAGKALLKHPALMRSGLGFRRLTADLPRLACGTPAVAGAVAELAADREH